MLSLDTLFPAARCILCHSALDGDSIGLCHSCAGELPFRNQEHHCKTCGHLLPDNFPEYCGLCQQQAPAHSRIISLFHYRPPLDYLIKQLKFNNDLLPADVLGKLMATLIRQQSSQLPQAIIPVPLHPKRLRQRGYNQALELAKPISKQLEIPLVTDLLVRKKHSKPQTQCSGKERRNNLRNAFACSHKPEFQSVALVDDVITTGTTTDEAAKVLKRQGIQEIHVWACAQTVE